MFSKLSYAAVKLKAAVPLHLLRAGILVYAF